MKQLMAVALLSVVLTPVSVLAQEPVVGAKDPEALFTDKDPALNADKQVVLHIMRDLLEANHWADTDGKADEHWDAATIQPPAPAR